MSNFQVIYRFASLSSLADYWDAKASEKRAHSRDPSPRILKKDRIRSLSEACAYEHVANVLRNTKIGEAP